MGHRRIRDHRRKAIHSWVAVSTIAILCAGLTGCTIHHHDSTDDSLSTYLSTPSVPDASLLPNNVPTLNITASTASATVAKLMSEAHQPGATGLSALVEFARAAGMPIVDESQDGKVVVPLAGQDLSYPIEAGQLVAIHESLVAGTTTSLNGILGLLADALPDGEATLPSMLSDISQDLNADAASQSVAARVWADAIIQSAPSGPALLNGAGADGDVQLDGLQSALLLLQLESAALSAGVVPPGASNSSPTASALSRPASSTAYLTADESTGGCDLKNEITQEALDGATSGIGSAREILHDMWYDYMIDEGATSLVKRQIAFNILGTVFPILQMIFAKLAFQASVSPYNPHLDRIKTTTGLGGEVELTATFKFLPQDNSHFTHCLALFMSGMLTDVTIPSSGAMHGIGVSWDLTSGGANGLTGDLGFVQMCGSGCGASPTHGGYTDGKGESTQVVQGLKQPRDMTDATSSFERVATVQASANPKDVEDSTAQVIKTITEALGTAASFTYPPAILTKVAGHLFYDLGALSVTKSVGVTDWSDGYTLNYTLTVNHYYDPGNDTTGQWTVAAKVPLTRESDGYYEGTATLRYVQDTVDQRDTGPLAAGPGIKYPSGTQLQCPPPGSPGPCTIPGCSASDHNYDSKTVNGYIDVIMAPSLDAQGKVIGVKDITYNLRGLAEELIQEESISGPCAFNDGSTTKTLGPLETNYVLQAWQANLNNAGMQTPYTWTGFTPQTGATLGTLKASTPSDGYEGALTETFDVEAGTP